MIQSICFNCDKCRDDVVIDNEFLIRHSDLFISLKSKTLRSLTFATTYEMGDLKLVNMTIKGDLNLGSLKCNSLRLAKFKIEGNLHLGNFESNGFHLDECIIKGDIFIDNSLMLSSSSEVDAVLGNIKYKLKY